MTTATTEQTNEVTTTAEEAFVEVQGTILDTWKGNIVNHTLSARAQSIAAAIEPLTKDTAKGIQWTKKDYYSTANKHGFATEALKDIEQFNADYASAVHAVSADKALARFKGEPEVEEFTVKAVLGENTTYRDNYRRFNSRSVRNMHTGETSVQENYGYHAPSVVTKYEGFNDSRQAVHNLAKDLLG